MANPRWSREEHLVAFALYCRIPFGKIHHNNPVIESTAKLIGRTPNALSMKLSNFARLDPALQARGIKGLQNGSKDEEVIWNEFHATPDRLAIESELALKGAIAPTAEPIVEVPSGETESMRTTKVRLVQTFFRSAVLSSYNYSCAFCGFSERKVLVASHIIPWSIAVDRRADPRNGLALCALHDKAFDRGLMSVDSSLRIVVSDQKTLTSDHPLARVAFQDISGSAMRQAERFRADEAAFAYHREHVFLG